MQGNNAGDIGSGIDLTKDELRHYDRQITLPDFGLEGQQKIKAASVLIVGCGGLGCPSAQFLAAAGVGRIGLVDYDTVSPSNLHRQVLYTHGDIGRSKVEVAAERLSAMNPFIQIDTFPVRLSGDNIQSIISDFDIILDGTDNFSTRYLINDACVLMNKVNVHAAIYRFEGQLSVFGVEDKACYRCVFPEAPPEGMVPSCAEAGVLGVLPGLLGTMQALETIKLITGIGDPLINRLLLVDTKTMSQRSMQIDKDPACPICSENASITTIEELEQTCGPSLNRLSAEDWRAGSAGDHFLLDVRDVHEYELDNLDGVNIPLGDLQERWQEIPSNQKIVVHCASGKRSEAACNFLVEKGLSQVFNLEGGLAKIRRLGLPCP